MTGMVSLLGFLALPFFISSSLAQEALFPELNMAIMEVDMRRICPDCPDPDSLSQNITIYTDNESTLELVEHVNNYGSNGSLSDDLFTYLQATSLKWAPEDGDAMLDWILTLQETGQLNMNAEMDSARKIYDATVDKEGTALTLDKRSWFNRLKCAAEHALKTDVCRSIAVGLYQSSVVTSSSWSRNICTNVGGDTCCLSWSKATSVRVGDMGYVAVQCENQCSGSQFSCEVWGLNGEDLDVCWSNRATGCT
jgi:hypothetical protein